MPSIGSDGRYQCTPAELQALLKDVSEDIIDVMSFYLTDEDMPLIQEIHEVVARALQAWHVSATDASPTPENT